MPGLFFGDWWGQLNLLQQSLWLLSVSSSLLLLILIVMSLLDPDTEAEANARLAKVFNARTILTFLTFFAWTGLGVSYYWAAPVAALGTGLIAGLLAAVFAKGITLMLLRLAPRGGAPRHPERLMATTGRVLAVVPSHRNGFGKVHLNVKGAPYELEAMTAGFELKPGASVRVVGVIEEGRVLVVEPLEDEGYPHEEHGLPR
ncbi:NfeD family protein [Phaeodactylibacter luteus]|uniref:NfeD-like C-terminal domain-containing protein n=1 Tax=Phaeodactylibacter luteus TaxID=1564516 RepID=A0A5C6RJT4_9BACT|nr:NfeD family protein [Phaeodactylibacter luteus]TXB62477.1 hypothetical protein FRY97_13880 [Phaeodactylibacter luteus]